MKWISHKLVTFATVLTFTGNPLFATLSIPGSVFPDAIEFLIYGSDIPRKKHRTYSHLTGWWLVIALSLLLFVSYTEIYRYLSYFTLKNLLSQDFRNYLFSYAENYYHMPVIPSILVFLTWFCFGAFMHCMEDALTGKVPLFNPKKKEFSMRLFRTGSLAERLFVLGYTLFCIICIYFHLMAQGVIS